MILPRGTAIALVDGEMFELYRNGGTATEPKLASMTVPALKATNFSAGAKDKDNISRFTPGKGKDRIGKLEESAHAAAVTDWLNQQALAGKFEKLVIAADPRSLGEMRRHYHKKLEEVLATEIASRLAGSTPEVILKALDAA